MTAWAGQSKWSTGLGARNLVNIGDYVFPRHVEWAFNGDGGDPNLKAVFEYRDERPQCVQLTVVSAGGGRPVRTSDLQLLELDKMTVVAFTRFAMRSTYDPETNVTTTAPVDDERGFWAAVNNLEAAVKAPRRGVSRSEIEKVAETYLEHVDGDPTAAVEKLLGYGRRTAERRIKMAEDAGLLPPTTPGKRRGKSTN